MSDAPATLGGGRVLPLPGASAATRGLARAAMALDAITVTETVCASLERRGVVATWDSLLVPVLAAAGERWAATREGVEVEHLLSECIQAALASTVRRTGPPINHRPVLLAAAEDELHALPLHALSAALRERQISSRVLGARVPRSALASAVRRSGPAVVFVWSQMPETGAAEELVDLTSIRPAPAVVVGGPGWQGLLPDGVDRVADLAEAVSRVVHVVAA